MYGKQNLFRISGKIVDSYPFPPKLRYPSPKRPERMSTTRVRKIKVVFGVICSSILVYQSFELISGYLTFDTIVMIENNDHNSGVLFPSVSICDLFPRLDIGKAFTVRKPIAMAQRFIQKGRAYFENGVLKADLKEVENIERDTKHKIRDNFYAFKDESIYCASFSSNTSACFPSFNWIGPSSQCRTYFSRIYGSGRVTSSTVRPKVINEEDLLNDIAYFAINFTHLNIEKEPLIEKEIFIMVHHSSGFPTDSTIRYSGRRFIIKANKTYDLSYIRKTIVRLPAPYKSDCQYYRPELNSTDIYSLSRGMCVEGCKNELFIKEFKCLGIWNKAIYGHNYSDMELCNRALFLRSVRNFDVISEEHCLTICKSNCIQEIYDFDLQEYSDNELSNGFKRYRNDSQLNYSDFSYFTLFAKHSDESLHKHIPKIKLTDFLCSIGGLFSLWLGLSVLSIFDYMVTTLLLINSRVKHHFY